MRISQKAGQLSAPAVDDKHVSFDALLDNDGKFKAHPLGDLKDAIVVLQYTGGTTGLPKGAMLTHANLSAACAQYIESTKGDPPILTEGGERALVVLPLFHIYALTVNLLFGVRLGALMVLHTRFDLDAVLQDLAAKKISVFAGVPTMYTAIINHPKASALDLKSLKFCGSGGAPLPVEVGQRFFALTGCQLNEGWGMTETSPTGTFTPARGKRKAGSCGMPLPGIELKFEAIGKPGQDAAPGEPGEMCIRGPNVMKGYWKNEAATKESFTADGYFRSGDIAYMDADGFVFIVDRSKDMLLCGGFNVYPRVLEEAIYEHPAVAEVCVIGIPDAYRGQSPKAFLTLKPGAAPFTIDELKALPEGPAGQARDGAGAGDPRRAAEDAGRQAVEEGPGRRRSAQARRLSPARTAPQPATTHGTTTMDHLSSMDAAFLHFETPETPMHVGSLARARPARRATRATSTKTPRPT